MPKTPRKPPTGRKPGRPRKTSELGPNPDVVTTPTGRKPGRPRTTMAVSPETVYLVDRHMAKVRPHVVDRNKTVSVDRARSIEAMAQALALRKSGESFANIAAMLGIAEATARRWVLESLRLTLQEPAEEVRTMELLRLDALLQSIWAQATDKGAPKQLDAIDRALDIMTERRFYIAGLDVKEAARVAMMRENRMSREEVRELVGEMAYAIRAALTETLPPEQVRTILTQMREKAQVLDAMLIDITPQKG